MCPLKIGMLQTRRRTALQSARLGSVDVAYVAVHGTGTPLGDPIEVGALGAALGGKGGGAGSGMLAPLVIGSSKVS
jgi:acyl transferase domain-containing protein